MNAEVTRVCPCCAALAGANEFNNSDNWIEARCQCCGVTKLVSDPRDFGRPPVWKGMWIDEFELPNA